MSFNGALRRDLDEWRTLLQQLTQEVEDEKKERQRLQSLLRGGVRPVKVATTMVWIFCLLTHGVQNLRPFVVVLIDADDDGYMVGRLRPHCSAVLTPSSSKTTF